MPKAEELGRIRAELVDKIFDTNMLENSLNQDIHKKNCEIAEIKGRLFALRCELNDLEGSLKKIDIVYWDKNATQT